MSEPAVFVVNVQVAVKCNDHLLVIGRSRDEAHAGGVLDIPGGKVDTLEIGPAVLEAVARREVLEETGVPVEVDLGYVCSASFQTTDGYSVINVVFGAVSDAPLPTKPQQSEVAFATWLPIREVLCHPDLPPWTAAYIRQAFPEIEVE
jgi:8-oxo-dGTP pyrophosphatase MutT (NUDIX family)